MINFWDTLKVRDDFVSTLSTNGPTLSRDKGGQLVLGRLGRVSLLFCLIIQYCEEWYLLWL